eukprot:1726055-Rhodomonas_salina.1
MEVMTVWIRPSLVTPCVEIAKFLAMKRRIEVHCQNTNTTTFAPTMSLIAFNVHQFSGGTSFSPAACELHGFKSNFLPLASCFCRFLFSTTDGVSEVRCLAWATAELDPLQRGNIDLEETRSSLLPL